MNNPLNEVTRIVVNFHSFLTDSDAARRLYPFSQETRLFIVGDAQAGDSVRYSLVGDAEWSYRLIDTLCSTRVVDAEFGRLLVDGKRLTAEKYLALWRTAQANTLDVRELQARFGITAVHHFALPTSVCRRSEDADAMYASPYLVQTDDNCTSWEVALDDVERIALAAQLRGVYWSRDELDQPVFKKEIRLRVRETTAREPQVQQQLADLFTEAE